MNRLDLFPITARIDQDTLTIAGLDLAGLAREHGTPLYLYDRATMDEAVSGYRTALQAEYPAGASITYAGKAFLTRGIAQWAFDQGLYVDCTGEGEIAIASAGGVPRERILVHGVNKSDADLNSAVRSAGTIVVDNLSELKKIARLHGQGFPHFPQLWLRLLPGVSVATHHAHTQTGHHDSKFGMTREEVMQAAEFCREHGLPLNGLHFHQGSNFRNAEPLQAAIELGLEVCVSLDLQTDWHFSPGGGWGVAYHEDELPQPNIRDYVAMIAEHVRRGCERHGLSLPHLHLEPGRSLVARAGVALYRVGSIKRRSEKTWVLTDGGMTDNPRFAMYGARYSCLPVAATDRERNELVSIAGPYCESGDVVIEDLSMPRLDEGELIAIPASGAYHLSMSSNYNGSRKPAVLWLENGTARVMTRRETKDDLLDRDS